MPGFIFSERPRWLLNTIYTVAIALNAWLLIYEPSAQTHITIIRIGLIVVCVFALALDFFTRHVSTPRKAAEELVRQQKALYSNRHEFAQVSSEAFKGLDRAFYERTEAALIEAGFRKVADLVDKTAAKEFRWAHAVIRTLVSDDGAISAGVYHLKILGLFKTLQWVGLLPRQIKNIDFETSLNDGTFVVTSNTLGGDTTGDVPGIDRLRMEPETLLQQQLDMHRERVGNYLAEDEDLSVIAVRNVSDVIAMQHRIQDVKNAHKKGIGFLNSEELTTIMDGKADEYTNALGDELDQMNRK